MINCGNAEFVEVDSAIAVKVDAFEDLLPTLVKHEEGLVFELVGGGLELRSGDASILVGVNFVE